MRCAHRKRLNQTTRPACGLAALVVVMGLFLVLALVATYANRNIIIEQRISSGSVRSERAAQAADSAVDWVSAMLNSGAIDTRCQPTTDASLGDFRSRYLLRNSETNGYDYVARSITSLSNKYYAGCRLVSSGELSCICPNAGNLGLNPLAGDDNSAAFRVNYDAPVAAGSAETRAGTVTIQVRGCANAGTASQGCLANVDHPATDAIVDVRAHLGLVKALPAVPAATITTGRYLDASSATALHIANTDPTTGIGIQTGGAATWPSGTVPTVSGPAGSTSTNDSRVIVPPDTAALTQQYTENPNGSGCQSGNCFFRRFFAMDQSLYKRQPAVVRLSCNGGCNLSDLTTTQWTGQNAGRPIYVDGDLTLDSSPTSIVGTSARPMLLIVSGTLTISASMDLVGLAYAHDIVWSASSGSLRGALVAAQDLTVSGTLSAAYDSAVLRLMKDTYGSFVRIPAGWNRGGTE
ncbi:MAG: hypothetical protein RLZZ182_841 [Pseudomonadota bacterium]